MLSSCSLTSVSTRRLSSSKWSEQGHEHWPCEACTVSFQRRAWECIRNIIGNKEFGQYLFLCCFIFILYNLIIWPPLQLLACLEPMHSGRQVEAILSFFKFLNLLFDLLVTFTEKLHATWSAKLSSDLILLNLLASFNIVSHKSHPHKPSWYSMVVCFLPGMSVISSNRRDTGLLYADSPLVSHKSQCSALFCSFSIPVLSVR